MARISYSKRLLSLVMALALVVACLVTGYAGSFTTFMGDSNTSKCQIKITTNGVKVEYTIGSASRSTRSMYTGNYDLGSKCTLTAVDTDTREFM